MHISKHKCIYVKSYLTHIKLVYQLQIWIQNVTEYLSLRKREGFCVRNEASMQQGKERIQKGQIFEVSKIQQGKKGLRKD